MAQKQRFLISSEQCELLLQFETCTSLAELSKKILRDVSVISRSLQELAPLGVVEKKENRWILSTQGRQINNASRAAISAQQLILGNSLKGGAVPNAVPTVDSKTAFIILGMQHGFDDEQWGLRNNVSAESNISAILSRWRALKGRVFHIRHESNDARSPLCKGTHGCTYKPMAVPTEGEIEITKSANSAFVRTEFEKTLRQHGIEKLVIVGFSSNHCVDATTRMAADLGFLVTVVSDACVAFERVAPDGLLLNAEEIHRVVMANLNQEFATLISTATLLQTLE